MAIEFVQPGKIMDVKLSAAAEYHAVVAIDDDGMVGITRAAGAENDVVACDVEGVFRFGKNAGSAITAGTPVTIDASTGKAAATSSGYVSNGICFASAASADTVVEVKINVFIPVGTITAADLTSYSTTTQADAKYVSAVEAGSAAGKIKVTKNSVATEFSVPT